MSGLVTKRGKKTVLNIGFDDTDSPKGMCTTFLAYKVVDLLKNKKLNFLIFQD